MHVSGLDGGPSLELFDARRTELYPASGKPKIV